MKWRNTMTACIIRRAESGTPRLYTRATLPCNARTVVVGRGQQLFTSGLVSLAPRFEEADAGRDGNVEALDRAGHGNAHELVASLTSETAQSGAFETHGDGERAGQVGVVECLCLPETLSGSGTAVSGISEGGDH